MAAAAAEARRAPAADDRAVERARRLAEEGALVGAILAGQTDLYRHLVLRYQGSLLGTLARLLGSRADAEDVAQQSFVDAYAALARFDRSRRFSTWLYRIALNSAKDWLKSHKRGERSLSRAVCAEETVFAGSIPAPDRVASANETKRRLDAALAELPLAFREVVLLKDIEGLSYDEIHEILGHPITTLKIRAVRGRAALRRLVEADGGEDDR